MKFIKITLALIVIAISIYSLWSNDFSYGRISALLLGIFIAMIGIEEWQTKEKNNWGMFFIPVSLIVITVAIFSF